MHTADCRLVDDIYTYNYVSQGKITIPSMDDNEEMGLTDVRPSYANSGEAQLINLIRSLQRSRSRIKILFYLFFIWKTHSSVEIVTRNYHIRSPSFLWHSVVCQFSNSQIFWNIPLFFFLFRLGFSKEIQLGFVSFLKDLRTGSINHSISQEQFAIERRQTPNVGNRVNVKQHVI